MSKGVRQRKLAKRLEVSRCTIEQPAINRALLWYWW